MLFYGKSEQLCFFPANILEMLSFGSWNIFDALLPSLFLSFPFLALSSRFPFMPPCVPPHLSPFSPFSRWKSPLYLFPFISNAPVSVHSLFRAHEYIKGEIARIPLYSVKQIENNMFLSTFFIKTFALYCKTAYLCIRFWERTLLQDSCRVWKSR